MRSLFYLRGISCNFLLADLSYLCSQLKSLRTRGEVAANKV